MIDFFKEVPMQEPVSKFKFFDVPDSKDPEPKPSTTPPPKKMFATATTISQACVKLVKDCEGCKLEAYLDSVGVPTIGYGHTEGVKEGMTISQQEAEDLLKIELKKFEQAVVSLVKVVITQHQLDALVSFAYNVGTGNLKSSTLLKLLNMGEYNKAAQQFLRWNKAGGKELAGLTRRRQREKALFES